MFIFEKSIGKQLRLKLNSLSHLYILQKIHSTFNHSCEGERNELNLTNLNLIESVMFVDCTPNYFCLKAPEGCGGEVD